MIKAVFSEENYVPQTASCVGKHAHLNHDRLFIVSQLYRLKLINNFKGDHAKHNLGQILKLKSAVVTLNIRSKSN